MVGPTRAEPVVPGLPMPRAPVELPASTVSPPPSPFAVWDWIRGWTIPPGVPAVVFPTIAGHGTRQALPAVVVREMLLRRTVAQLFQEEAKIWETKKAKAKGFLEFWKKYLGLSKTRDKDDPVGDDCQGRLLAMIRAITWVESRHGTGAGNQPARDPMQAANPADDHWKKELFGDEKASRSRVVRGPKKSNVNYNELIDSAKGFYDKLEDKDKKDVPKEVFDVKKANEGADKGHSNEAFTEDMSYFWGMMFYLQNTNAPRTYLLDDCSWTRLLVGARKYNGGGDPKYEDKIKAALKSMGHDVK